MKIDITNAFTNDCKEYYRWELYDGPDGIEHVHGFATDLIQCFSKILEWHERISADYNDLNNDDETNCGPIG
jgi:hypothetical protein